MIELTESEVQFISTMTNKHTKKEKICKHRKVYNRNRHTCIFCIKKFDHKHDYDAHIMQIHPAEHLHTAWLQKDKDPATYKRLCQLYRTQLERPFYEEDFIRQATPMKLFISDAYREQYYLGDEKIFTIHFPSVAYHQKNILTFLLQTTHSVRLYYICKSLQITKRSALVSLKALQQKGLVAIECKGPHSETYYYA